MGICTMEYNESWPFIVEVLIGTPITGSEVNAATLRVSGGGEGRCGKWGWRF